MAIKSEFTKDEEVVIEEMVGAFGTAAEWLHVEEEEDDEDGPLPSVDTLSDEARCQMLKDIYEEVGEESITELIQILQDSLDSEMRCPK
jgi:hypothetical protein